MKYKYLVVTPKTRYLAVTATLINQPFGLSVKLEDATTARWESAKFVDIKNQAAGIIAGRWEPDGHYISYPEVIVSGNFEVRTLP